VVAERAIATFTFDFGDGTIVGPQSKATASHAFAAAGTFTVAVTVADTAGNTARAVGPPVTVDAPPAAVLSVTPAWNAPPLAVTADASASTDTDSTPIATYAFDFGDGRKAGPQAAPKAVHTYAAEGTYTVSATVTDTAGHATTVKRTVDVAAPAASDLSVYAGYYDTHHPNNPQAKPSPWEGSANTVFVGQADSPSGGWDSSAVRVQNNTASAVTVTVTVTIGKYSFDLWGQRTIGAGQNLVLAQMGFETFDGSDTSTAGCYSCDAVLCTTSVSSVVPVVNVTVSGVKRQYFDRGQVLNTGGVDRAGCPYTGKRSDESEAWSPVPGPG
jgi:PKD repeat protein